MIGSYLDKNKQTSGDHDFHSYTETKLKKLLYFKVIVSAILLVGSTTRRETPI